MTRRGFVTALAALAAFPALKLPAMRLTDTVQKSDLLAQLKAQGITTFLRPVVDKQRVGAVDTFTAYVIETPIERHPMFAESNSNHASPSSLLLAS